MDGELFRDWLERHFLLYASHYMADVVRIAASKGVILFCLPPNITRATQPLENTCLHSLKQQASYCLHVQPAVSYCQIRHVLASGQQDLS